ncbi:voltage-dependent calcium channel gamma-7 subunit-like [Babylonia areolata]|uniref:voltage-dependent calcium channel gamma-7 subunit-like n=1 Tax=Babylonia areolata TaxID=304850 RepID=UPI003FD4A8F0
MWGCSDYSLQETPRHHHHHPQYHHQHHHDHDHDHDHPEEDKFPHHQHQHPHPHHHPQQPIDDRFLLAPPPEPHQHPLYEQPEAYHHHDDHDHDYDYHQQHHHHHHHHQGKPPHPHPSFRHNQQVVATSRCSTFMLTGAALFSGAVTLVALALAVSTDFWLLMREPHRVPPEELAKWNLTEPVETNIMVHVRSGLWNVCTMNLKFGNESLPDICIRIDFSQEGTGRMEGAPRCMTITQRLRQTKSGVAVKWAIRVAAPLPVASLILAVAGILMCALGSLKRNGSTVIAAVLYILAGLCLAVGVVLFISAIYDELGYHAQTTGHSPKDFNYHYGWSFYVAGSAFVSSELSAVMCVTLYLRHNARVQDMVRIIPGLESKLEGDLEEGQRSAAISASDADFRKEGGASAAAGGAEHDVIW